MKIANENQMQSYDYDNSILFKSKTDYPKSEKITDNFKPELMI